VAVTFPYPPDVELAMQILYRSLREHDRRRYAAVEVAKLGHGGLVYITALLGCDAKTVRQGQQDLQQLADQDLEDIAPDQRVRRPGGGRKPATESLPDLLSSFHAVLEDHTGGDPMRAEVIWTDLTPREIGEALMEKDLYVCEQVIRQLLDDEGYRRRQIQKYLDMGGHEDRDAQFKNIARIKKDYLDSPNPILSIDTKKKELLGTFYRDGRVYTRQGLLAYDHDFPSYADGVVIPYGLYDLKRNFGYLSVGTSRDTTEFACDSIGWWWENYGRSLYPEADSICLLCDGGGSNSADKYLFKEDLQKLADRLGREIRMAHFPPYCSKYNPIERRLFPHVTRACQGVIFDSVATVKRLLEKTRTAKGLGVVVEVVEKVYQTGRKYAEGFKKEMKIVFDEYLPKWNYRAIPATP
jgi:Rhodopirellula transposase DDE domain